MCGIFDSMRVSLPATQCIYCGDTKTRIDAFPPVDVTGDDGAGFCFPCCNECGYLAKTSDPLNFRNRVTFIKIAIRNLHRKMLGRPDWSAEEIAEIGPGMREEVIKWQESKNNVQKRIAWNVEEFFLGIVKSKDFVELNARINIMENEDVRGLLRRNISCLSDFSKDWGETWVKGV